jgi:hypothetical protein
MGYMAALVASAFDLLHASSERRTMHRSDYFPETYCISVVQFAIELYSWGSRIIRDCVLPFPVINFGSAGATCLSDGERSPEPRTLQN